MRTMTRLLAVSVCLIGLIGCAATVNQSGMAGQPQQPRAFTQTSDKSLILRVSGNAGLQANSDWADFNEEWRKSMEAAAANANMSFTFASDDDAANGKAGTLVRVKVNDFKYLSQVKRYMLGLMAGNGSMNVDVDYIDLPSKKLLATKNFSTSTNASEGIFSAATPKQVEAVSLEIVNDLRTAAATR
jgi:hypothetical protein